MQELEDRHICICQVSMVECRHSHLVFTYIAYRKVTYDIAWQTILVQVYSCRNTHGNKFSEREEIYLKTSLTKRIDTLMPCHAVYEAAIIMVFAELTVHRGDAAAQQTAFT